MARTTSFTKRTLISKANSNMVIATSIAAFVLVLALIGGKSLLSQASYQSRVISAKKTALAQLESNQAAMDSLRESYTDFANANPNALGGNPEGTGELDGDNVKIVLDSLPSKYDFPALITSVEKLVQSQNLQIIGIGGTDEEIIQKDKQTSTEPIPISMPFQVQVTGAYPSIQGLVGTFERSIRPFQIQTLELSGDETSMVAVIDAQTYFQPTKKFNIKDEVVK